jgi:hypothetical protein
MRKIWMGKTVEKGEASRDFKARDRRVASFAHFTKRLASRASGRILTLFLE